MPYILPQPAPRQTAWDQLGFAAGVGTDVLLKAILAGQVGLAPNQGRPQGMQGPLTSSGQFYPQPQAQPPIRLGPFQVQPDLSRQLQQEQIKQAQAQTGWLNRAGAGTPSMNPLTGEVGASSSTSSFYQVGDVVERKGKRARITGFDTDGTPLVEPL